jgi:hypothetical protein
MTRVRGAAWGFTLLLLSSGLPREALACATCGAGDSTLTGLGTEQPFAGRLRSSLELSYRTDAIGVVGLDRIEVREARADASVAWAPTAELFLVALVPSVYREATDPTLAQSESWGLGDMELRAKWFVYRDRSFAPRWLFATLGGVKLPTAPWQSDNQGDLLPLEVQPGTGSLDLLLGTSLATFQGGTSAYASVQWFMPLKSRPPLEPGSSLRGSLMLQHQILRALALRGAADGRWDQPSLEAGERDPNSGGWIVFLGGDVLVSPAADLNLSFGVRVPAFDDLAGAHAEGARASVAVMVDW